MDNVAAAGALREIGAFMALEGVNTLDAEAFRQAVRP